MEFTYSAVGVTANTPPAGYVVDHTRIKLGAGEGVFQNAKGALRRLAHFNLGWVEAIPNSTPIEAGQVVAVLARVLGIWWLNACRIVYVVDDSESAVRFGFAYGTLPGHAESGEKRFVIEWDRTDDSVWYDIQAFSRPNFFYQARLSARALLPEKVCKELGGSDNESCFKFTNEVSKS